MKRAGYYKIDEMHVTEGKLELLENERYGDGVPAMVYLNGECIGETWDGLHEFWKEWQEWH